MNIISRHSVIVNACIIILSSCSLHEKDKQPTNVKPVVVKVMAPVRQVSKRITLSGQIESQETTIISSRIMGIISSIRGNPGDHVYKGQSLVTISADDIAARRAQAVAMVSEADIVLVDAERDYERFKKLREQQSASQKEFENAAVRYHSFSKKAEAALQLKNEADAAFAYTTLDSPYDGVITRRYLDQGSMANPGMPIIAIERSGNYRVSASISENEVDKVIVGMIVRVTVKSTGKIFKGRVSEISPSSQFTGGQYKIKVTLPDKSTGLFPGMYANVSICLENDTDTQSLYVPVSSIVQKDQLSGVYTVSDDQTAQLRWLKVGQESEGQVEILSGLNFEETVITQSDGRLYSGVPVIVK